MLPAPDGGIAAVHEGEAARAVPGSIGIVSPIGVQPGGRPHRGEAEPRRVRAVS